MEIKYAKYHGCGNDFIITEEKENTDYSKVSKALCNRYTGIGADTFIVVKKDDKLTITFYNADGTRAPMCGNGIRCASAYFRDHLNVYEDEYKIHTDSGVRTVYYKDGLYKINMGKPDYSIKKLDIDFDKDELFDYNLEYKGKTYNLNAVFMTTHHLVIIVDDLNISEEIGSYFCNHKLFTKKINVNFVKILDRNNIMCKTYERGVGFTKACGSGTSSCFVVLRRKGLIDNNMTSNYEYGKLIISEENGDIYMLGPAKQIANNINFVSHE